jgi:3-oxoacyl-[acyl-carrier protein] reductase
MSTTTKPPAETNVLVTGAGRGIGAAIARRFAAAGMNVAVHYFAAREAAEETARRCAETAGRVLTVQADIRSRDEVLRLKEQLERYGMLPDILVNNAGVAQYGLLTDLTEDEWDRVIDINLKGTFLCTQAFVPPMVRRKYGRIINVSSVWGLVGASCEAAYSAAKGGVIAFTKAMAKELAPSGITVNAVAPGVVETGMIAHLDDEERLALQREIPVGRFARPEEIASAVYFLALPESGYITGQVLSPNGGWQT